MSLVSGLVGAQASSSAANTQAAATTQASSDANATQLAMYAMSREDTAPWRKKGEDALNALATKIYAGPGDYTKSPGYDFRLAEGIKPHELETRPIPTMAELKAVWPQIEAEEKKIANNNICYAKLAEIDLKTIRAIREGDTLYLDRYKAEAIAERSKLK